MTPDWQDLELSSELIQVLLEEGLKKPTRIQQLVIPHALELKDIFATSPTGTGKTLAYLLPVFQYLVDFPRSKPGSARALVLAPTRELANQIGLWAEKLGKATGLKSLTITGGVNYGSHLGEMEKNLDIVIATPGRLIDYLAAEQFSAHELELMVLDEGDRLLDMGFRGAVEQIQSEAPHLKQRFLFSATNDDHSLRAFSKAALNAATVIDAEPPKRERGKITQWLHIADTLEHKVALLSRTLKEYTGRVLVFVKKRERVHEVHALLQREGFNCLFLEGELPQDERQKRLAAFHSLRSRILVATDVAARGIDVPDVELVVNFDLPVKGDTYVHRIGRTGRAGKKGTAISLVEAHDAIYLGRIEKYLGQKIERRFIKDLRPQFKFPEPDKIAKKKSKAKKVKKKEAKKKAATKKPSKPKK
ncbi:MULTISPECIES: ATP-dependent RNA helicase SrmB [Gammaproteobacteria]|uniref:ATP-dependent RNA helicase SrmB n=1 Tax=Gammaproteobacteria TaxID=1236 RepID=UPI000DCF9105|nr:MULTISPECIES: ATP-dependent RNA helicase SrmB [Gammaproteobacteria]RTE85549.1 ATP-dependent RNA helicase SrmB [Aliidiomarina sp. B3213]TCZ89519.1 ATP-dependent RNA helicase SrmB [Lysobacter sp. N42]